MEQNVKTTSENSSLYGNAFLQLANLDEGVYELGDKEDMIQLADEVKPAEIEADIENADDDDSGIVGIVDTLTDIEVDDDEDKEAIKVYDGDAEDETELKDSYVGYIILSCNACRTPIFKQKEEVVIDEDGEVNATESCPYCSSTEGYTIKGMVADYEAEPEATAETDDGEEVEVDVKRKFKTESANKPIHISARKRIGEKRISGRKHICHHGECEDEYEESVRKPVHTRSRRSRFSEDIEKATIETDGITYSIEQRENNRATDDDEEMIVPLDRETEEEFEDEIEYATDEGEDTEEIEVGEDVTEVEEESFNRLGTRYLRRVYENVANFKTTDIYRGKRNTLCVEGIVTLKQGNKKKTKFVFEAYRVGRNNIRLVGMNESFSNDKRAFVVEGKLRRGAMISESFSYNYKYANKRVRGTINESVKRIGRR